MQVLGNLQALDVYDKGTRRMMGEWRGGEKRHLGRAGADQGGSVYLVLQSCPNANEIEGIHWSQALAPCKSHVSLGDLRRP